jgi:predicted MPP superfamily phosphohydrolase
MDVLLLMFALLGHVFLWVGLLNRLHALGMRRRTIHRISAVYLLCAGLIPVGIGWQYFGNSQRPTTTLWTFLADGTPAGLLITAYLVTCWLTAPATLFRFLWFRVFRRPPPMLRFHRRRRVEIDPASAAASAAELAHHPLVRLPLNEILQLELSQWVLDVPRMAPALDGLSIVHLSDLHFTGRVGKAYFRELVRFSNELRPDLVCITGDIIDRTACFDWLADTIGQLVARHGVYFVLGNHDYSVDLDRLRRTLQRHGLIDLGGRWLTVEIGGTPVVLAGNERPWIAAAADLKDCLPPAPAGPLRILLAHTPDQFAWARAHQADLLLVGHTHGGQIRIPPLGAIFSPSAEGVKYISGIYYVPPTILHVTRGVSGDVPVRWNCRPEIAHLRLQAGDGDGYRASSAP